MQCSSFPLPPARAVHVCTRWVRADSSCGETMKVTKPSRVRLSPSTRDTEEEESEESSEESRLAELGSRMPGHTDKVNTIFTCTHRNQTRLRRCFQDKSTAKLRKSASYLVR